jgi:proline dehydrogenase
MKFLYRPLYAHFTAGETTISLQQTIQRLRQTNVLPIADYIKEAAKNDEDVANITKEYMKLVTLPDLNFIAVKPSSFLFQKKPMENLIRQCIMNNKRILVDAEEVKHHTSIQSLSDNFIRQYNSDQVWIYKTYQMYRYDSLDTLKQDMIQLPNLGIKLVRGAYWNQDRATGKLFVKKSDTDVAFRKALELSTKGMFHTMVCTHNPNDIQYMIENKVNLPIRHASLYGFIPAETKKIIQAGIATYKYLPYGPMDDAIPYLARRIQENPWILRHLFH